MGLFSDLFGGTHTKDLGVYIGSKGQRQKAADSMFSQYSKIMDPSQNDRFWGENYNDYLTRSGLGALGPQGGLTWQNLIGGSYGGPRYAHAGHASASLVDLNAEPYQTQMRDDIRQGFVGNLRRSTEAGVESGIRRANVTAELGGLSPAARALMALRARTQGADTVGQGTTQFVTDAYRNALQRQAEARQLNAQLGTQVSETNAQLATQASMTNAGIGSSYNAGRSAQESAAARFLAEMYGQNQDRDLQRYRTAHDMGMDLQRPINQKTMYQDPGIISKLATGVSNIAGMGFGLAGMGKSLFGGLGGGGGAAGGGPVGGASFSNYGPWASGYGYGPGSGVYGTYNSAGAGPQNNYGFSFNW